MHPPTENPASWPAVPTSAPAAAPAELDEPLRPAAFTLELSETHQRELETLARGYEVSPEQFVSANLALLLDVLAGRYTPKAKLHRAS